MDETQTLLELRVLAGLQAGARLSLPEGRYVLGSAETCDIVLAGPGIEQQALVIVVDGLRLDLQPGQPGCGLSAGDSLSEPFKLEPGVPFYVGDIWLVVDHRSRPWPENRSWLASMPPPLEALTLDAADKTGVAQDAKQDEPLTPTRGLKRRLLWWLKWAAWCIAVFCLGGLGILAWFKYGMEYLPHVQAHTVAHLSRWNDAPVSEAGSGSVQVQPPVAAQEPSTQKPPASGLLLLGTAPTAPVAESPMLGLPLPGSHLEPRGHRDRPAQKDDSAASTADMADLPFVVRQVDCGSVASITTDGGVRFFEGAKHRGYELTRVSAERLRLRGGHDVELSC